MLQSRFKMEHMLILLTISLLTLFQSCGVMPNACDSTSNQNCKSTQSSSTSATTSNSQNSGNSNVGLGGPSTGTGSGSGPGYNGSGSSSPAPGSGSSGGSGGYSSGGSGSSSSGGPSTVGGPLNVTTQPLSKNVAMGSEFQLIVAFGGGTPPYTYQWYFNNIADTTYIGQNYNYINSAFRYDNEGTYYLVIKDSTGASVRTNTVRMTVLDPIVSCAARAHYTSVANTQFVEPLATLFTNSRGNYFWPADYQELAPIGLDALNNAALNYLGVARHTFPSGNFGGLTQFGCAASDIPKVHRRVANPEYNPEYFSSPYADSTYYKYEGSISFECRGGKWLFKSNTCQWKYYPPPPDPYSGGGA